MEVVACTFSNGRSKRPLTAHILLVWWDDFQSFNGSDQNRHASPIVYIGTVVVSFLNMATLLIPQSNSGLVWLYTIDNAVIVFMVKHSVEARARQDRCLFTAPILTPKINSGRVFSGCNLEFSFLLFLRLPPHMGTLPFEVVIDRRQR